MNRRAPRAGYDFGNKRQYRRAVWAEFRKHCLGRLCAAQALLMPSAEGDEIDVALNAGFRDYNLHVVDRNPAIVAHLKRRHPRINTYGVSASKAAKRIAEAGVRLDVANLDLCSPLSSVLLDEVTAFAAAESMSRHGALIALTMLRGRERGDANDCLADARNAPEIFDGNDGMRLWIASGGLANEDANGDSRWLRHLVRHDVYRSAAGSQTMLWAIFRVRPFEAPQMSASIKTWVEQHIREVHRSARRLGPAAMLMIDPFVADIVKAMDDAGVASLP